MQEHNLQPSLAGVSPASRTRRNSVLAGANQVPEGTGETEPQMEAERFEVTGSKRANIKVKGKVGGSR